MKLLETSLSGYEANTELPKDAERANYEAWSRVTYAPRLVDPQFNGNVRASQSGLDGVIVLQTPYAECERRSKNRKIDPQTNIIYHLEDNPPPDDNKIKERLQDYTDDAGDASRMEQTSQRFSNSIQAITEWTERFGHLDQKTGECASPLDMVICPNEEASWKVQ